MGKARSILLVDDDEMLRSTWCKCLTRRGFGPVEIGTDGEEGLTKLRERQYDLCLLDLRMPRMTGMEVLAAAAGLERPTPIVMVSGYLDREEAVKAMRMGAVDVWFKPLHPRELAERISRLLNERRPPLHVVAERIDQWIAEHAKERGLRLGHVCAALGISTSYAAKLLHEHLGTSFRRRLRYHRAARAKELLEGSAAQIKTVAQESGFSNYRRMDEAFRALEGVSPQDYRRNNLLNTG